MRMIILPGVAAVKDWRLVFFNNLFYRGSVFVYAFKIRDIRDASPFLISSEKRPDDSFPHFLGILGYMNIMDLKSWYTSW
jgi:hypothetical protein